MKKNVSVIALAVSLIASIVVGSTLAFFTSQAQVNNTVTMGDVQISLTEPIFEESGVRDGDVIYMHDITPGQLIAKDPTITNTGSHDAYIRCKLDITGLDFDNNADNAAARKAQLLRGINIDSTKWVQANDGYYYYQEILPTSGEVKFFDKVKIPEEWDNAFAEERFSINVTAEAIQADNFTPHKTNEQIDGWNYSDGSSVHIESSSATSE